MYALELRFGPYFKFSEKQAKISRSISTTLADVVDL